MDFAQQLVNGVQIGSVYALVAIGYTMVYGIAKMINFAHGDIIMVGSYVALLFFQSSGLPVWGVIAATAAVSAVLGVTIERLAYKPLRGGSRMSALITTIGVSLMLQNGFLLIFGSSPKPFHHPVGNRSAQGAAHPLCNPYPGGQGHACCIRGSGCCPAHGHQH